MADNDEIVYTLVGVKGRYEGVQYGRFCFVPDDARECPPIIDETAKRLVNQIGDDLGVPAEHRDADWQARFTWIVRPMTQEDWDVQKAIMAGDWDD